MHKEQYNLNIRDINYANHMDHLALLNYLHETRVRFLRSHGHSELDVDGLGSGLVVAELNCKYKKECFYGEQIVIELSLELLSATRLIIHYKVSKADEVTVADAIIRVAFIDKARKVIKVPQWLQDLAQGELHD